MSSSDDRSDGGGAKLWLPVVAGVALVAGIVALVIKLNTKDCTKVPEKKKRSPKCPKILASKRRWPLEDKKEKEEDKKEEDKKEEYKKEEDKKEESKKEECDEPVKKDVDQECS